MAEYHHRSPTTKPATQRLQGFHMASQVEKHKYYTRILFHDLDDVVAKVADPDDGPGFTSISVLNPTIFVEVLEEETKEPSALDPDEDPPKVKVLDPDDYLKLSTDEKNDADEALAKGGDIMKITTSFTLEVAIVDFDRRYVLVPGEVGKSTPNNTDDNETTDSSTRCHCGICSIEENVTRSCLRAKASRKPSCIPSFLSGLKPADVRFMRDTGEPARHPDRFIFCVACMPITSPKLHTMDLREAAALQVARVCVHRAE